MKPMNCSEISEMMRNIDSAVAECKDRIKSEMQKIAAASEFMRDNCGIMHIRDIPAAKIITRKEDVL